MKNDLSERREPLGMSQADLAEAVGVTRQTINAIERERYNPSLELAFELAALFDCSIEDIFEPRKSNVESSESGRFDHRTP